MLVLPHADVLGIDLHQLRQRVLQPAPDRDGAADGDVDIGILLGPQLRSRVDGRPRFVDDGVVDGAVQVLEQAGHELLSLPRSGTVTDGDDPHAVLPDQLLNVLSCFLCLLLRRMGVDGAVLQQLSRLVQDRYLAAGAQPGINGQHPHVLDRRDHEKRPGVPGEHRDGVLFRPIGKRASYLPLDGRGDEALVAVLDGLLEIPGCDRAAVLDD